MSQQKKPAHILIADDDESVLFALETILHEERYGVTTVPSGREAWDQLRDNAYDIALVDLTLEDLDGLAILQQAHQQHLDVEIILITGHGSIDTAVQAMRMGAYDYLTKPVDGKELLRIIEHALERRNLLRENRSLQERLASLSRYEGLIGKSPQMQALYKTLDAVAPTGASVLIVGESGTGKELVARAIHSKSNRAEGPFLAINCAALPANILESELFGHEKGAFTGATRDKLGFFEQADGGTLFLDELAEMPYELQAKLLRVLETQSFRRVGGSREIQVDVRVLAATNANPEEAVRDKKLRDDLYFRLAVLEIETPPLRERPEDIPLMANEFLSRFAGAANKKLAGFADAAMDILMHHSWPGNVRELRNAIERAVILCQGNTITPSDLPARMLQQASRNQPPAKVATEGDAVVAPIGTKVADMEKELILRTLEKLGNNKTRAAQVLGISLKTLHNKLGRYREFLE